MYRRVFGELAAVLGAAICITGPASAQSLSDAQASVLARSGQPDGVWSTTVVPVGPVAAKDPLWAATLVTPAARNMIIASLAEHLGAPRAALTGGSHSLTGMASYYSQGERTATGEMFDPMQLTAAHKTLPFGTRVKVTRVDNGDSVVVRINDRGPFKPGRVIDLSQGAAENLHMTALGLTAVRLEVLGK